MNLEDLFKIEPQEPYKMTQKEFVEKTKTVLNKICNSYSQGWQSRLLRDDEHPEESVCDKCTGCGIFTDNGDEKECVQDIEQGDCFHRFCDYEQVGMDLEAHLKDIILKICSIYFLLMKLSIRSRMVVLAHNGYCMISSRKQARNFEL